MYLVSTFNNLTDIWNIARKNQQRSIFTTNHSENFQTFKPGNISLLFRKELKNVHALKKI